MCYNILITIKDDIMKKISPTMEEAIVSLYEGQDVSDYRLSTFEALLRRGMVRWTAMGAGWVLTEDGEIVAKEVLRYTIGY